MESFILSRLGCVIFLVYEVVSLELLGHYKLWHSVSDQIVYDYSGNDNHAILQGAYVFTDRGLCDLGAALLRLPKNSLVDNPGSTESVLSFWYLYKAGIFDLFFSTVGDPNPKYLAVHGTDTYFKILATNFFEIPNSCGFCSIVAWRLVTVKVAINYSDTTSTVEVYRDLLEVNKHTYTSYAQNILHEQRLYTNPYPNTVTYNTIYEAWWHVGVSSIAELQYLISSGSSCTCSYGCVTSPTIQCLNALDWTFNQDGELCDAECRSVSQSCDTRDNCILRTNFNCKYGLYSLETGECLFYCPEDSCICSSGTSFSCTCKVGYLKLSDDPPACITDKCLEYHKEGYEYVCDVLEEGYALSTLGECCTCDYSYIAVFTDPLVCIKIANCLSITQEGNQYICSDCSEGYLTNEEGKCNECEEGYETISQDPFTCAKKVENCTKYAEENNDWICEECHQGYKLSSSYQCDDCDNGYVRIGEGDLICKDQILNCLEYEVTSSDSICLSCEMGYILSSNNQCSECEPGFISVAITPITCAKNIANCAEYVYDESVYEWSCKECKEGYLQVFSEVSVCISEIQYCSEYTTVANESRCTVCNEGFQLDCGDSCEYGTSCQCSKGNYLSLDGKCEKCPDECKECIQNSDIVECLKCELGFSVEEKSCKPDESSPERTTVKEATSNPVIGKAAQVTQGAILTSSFASILSVNFNSVLAMMGTMQILSFALLYNLNIPARAKVMMQGVSLFEVVPNLFEYFSYNESTLKIERYERMEYTTEIIFINSGKTFTVFSFILVFYAIFKILYLTLTKKPDTNLLKKISKKALDNLEWNMIVGFITEGILELTVASLLNVYYSSFDNIYSTVGFAVSSIIFIGILISPVILFLFYLKNFESIKANTLPKYEVLFSNVKTGNIYYLLLNILTMLRRIVFGLNIVLLYSSPYIQIVINSCFSFAICHFIIIFKPYKTRFDHIMNLFTEGNIFMIQCILGAYINEDLPTVLYEIADWGIVTLLYMSILVPALSNIILTVKELILKCRRTIKHSEVGSNMKFIVSNIRNLKVL